MRWLTMSQWGKKVELQKRKLDSKDPILKKIREWEKKQKKQPKK